MEHLSTQVERRQIDWRRAQVLELSSQGHSQREIADTIHVGIGTINRDMAYLRNEAQENLKSHPRQTPRRISKLYDWNKSGVKDMLGDC
jgi:transposase